MDADGNALGKIFIGGLSQLTNNNSLHAYFSTFGTVDEAVVMMDYKTGRSRGFGYVKFNNIESAEKVLTIRPHIIDGKLVETKQCNVNMKGKSRRNLRVFVGGIGLDEDTNSIISHFSKYGKLTDVNLSVDSSRQRHRGFAFVSFEDEAVVRKLIEKHYVELNGKNVEIKAMQPPNFLRRGREINPIIDNEAYQKQKRLGGNMSNSHEMIGENMYYNKLPQPSPEVQVHYPCDQQIVNGSSMLPTINGYPCPVIPQQPANIYPQTANNKQCYPYMPCTLYLLPTAGMEGNSGLQAQPGQAYTTPQAVMPKTASTGLTKDGQTNQQGQPQSLQECNYLTAVGDRCSIMQGQCGAWTPLTHTGHMETHTPTPMQQSNQNVTQAQVSGNTALQETTLAKDDGGPRNGHQTPFNPGKYGTSASGDNVDNAAQETSVGTATNNGQNVAQATVPAYPNTYLPGYANATGGCLPPGQTTAAHLQALHLNHGAANAATAQATAFMKPQGYATAPTAYHQMQPSMNYMPSYGSQLFSLCTMPTQPTYMTPVQPSYEKPAMLGDN